MASYELNVKTRTETGKAAAKRLRRQGLVPAVAYGHKEAPAMLIVNSREIRDLLVHHHANGLITLKVEGAPNGDMPVIIKDLQRHAVRHTVAAVDFLRVSLDEEVTAHVQIILDGEPVGVKIGGGVLVQALHELEVAALPQNLPEQLHVDVSELELNGDPIHVEQIKLPEGVRVITALDESVAVVNPPEPEEVVEPVVEEGAEGEAAAGEGEAAAAAE